MKHRKLGISGAWEFLPTLHHDSRGLFLENYTSRVLEEVTGRTFSLSQLNVSVSRRGVIRGIHASTPPPGQAKYIMCLVGRILDVVVDLRSESPTFGQWEAITLDDTARKAVFISEGLGHGFQVLSDSATVVYATSTPYDPNREFSVNPFDRDLALPWISPLEPTLSNRDLDAPALVQQLASKRPPTGPG